MSESRIVIRDIPLAELTEQQVSVGNMETMRRTGRTASTLKQQMRTERMWAAWCQTHGIPASRFEVVYVDRFIREQAARYSRVSIQNMLSHLRSLVAAMMAGNEQTRAYYSRQYEALKAYRLADDLVFSGSPKKRGGKRMSKAQVRKALNPRTDNPIADHQRAALFALALYAGPRREQMRTLRWEQVNFDTNTITMIGGKRKRIDKQWIIPMIGQLPDVLREWKAIQTRQAIAAGESGDRAYLFCVVRKDGRLGPDRPMSSGSVYNAFRVLDAQPHDARHTLISTLMDGGVPDHEIMAITGHSAKASLDQYGHAGEAAELAQKLPDPYGH